MTDGFTAIIFGVGFGTWVFSHMMHSTMRTSTSVIAGGACGVAGFIVIFTLMKFVFHF